MKLSVAASCLLCLPIPTAMASTAKATKAKASPQTANASTNKIVNSEYFFGPVSCPKHCVSGATFGGILAAENVQQCNPQDKNQRWLIHQVSNGGGEVVKVESPENAGRCLGVAAHGGDMLGQTILSATAAIEGREQPFVSGTYQQDETQINLKNYDPQRDKRFSGIYRSSEIRRPQVATQNLDEVLSAQTFLNVAGYGLFNGQQYLIVDRNRRAQETAAILATPENIAVYVPKDLTFIDGTFEGTLYTERRSVETLEPSLRDRITITNLSVDEEVGLLLIPTENGGFEAIEEASLEASNPNYFEFQVGGATNVLAGAEDTVEVGAAVDEAGILVLKPFAFAVGSQSQLNFEPYDGTNYLTSASSMNEETCNGQLALVDCQDAKAEWLFFGAELFSAACWIHGHSAAMAVNEDCTSLELSLAEPDAPSPITRAQSFMFLEPSFVERIVDDTSVEEGELGQPSFLGDASEYDVDVVTGVSAGSTGLSDIRLKHQIALISKSPSGIPIYTFKYQSGMELADNEVLDNKSTFVGVMAQDLLEIAPHAVTKNEEDGYYRVDYSQIDVDFGKL